MIQAAYALIKENKNMNTDELAERLKIRKKSVLWAILNSLRKEGLVYVYRNICYDLSHLELKTGFAQWNLLGKCWVSEKDETNEFGLAFHNPKEGLIQNKYDTFYGHAISYKELFINEERINVVVGSKKHKDTLLAIKYNEDQSIWTIINSLYNFGFHLNETARHNDVYLYSTESLGVVEKLGNLNDGTVVDKVTKLLSSIESDGAVDADLKEYDQSDELKLLKAPFFTLDTEGATLLDDAISCETNDDGYTINVAISLVAPTALGNQELHEKIKKNITSLYLPTGSQPLIDFHIARRLSLDVGQEREALICRIELDKLLNTKKHSFFVAKIKSQAQLNYDSVEIYLSYMNNSQMFGGYCLNSKGEKVVIDIENQPDKKILEGLRVLYAISCSLFKKKDTEFDFDKKVKILFDENNEVSELKGQNYPISESIVSGLMKMVNVFAADCFFENTADEGGAIFRNQTQEFRSANYHVENKGHLGLDVTAYTHFTAPLRRYPDIIAQDCMLKIINGKNNYYSQDVSFKKINDRVEKYKLMSRYSEKVNIDNYIEKINKQKAMETIFVMTNFNEAGISVTNRQNISFFIPRYRLKDDLLDLYEGWLDSEMSIQEKKQTISSFNVEYDLFVELDKNMNLNYTLMQL